MFTSASVLECVVMPNTVTQLRGIHGPRRLTVEH